MQYHVHTQETSIHTSLHHGSPGFSDYTLPPPPWGTVTRARATVSVNYFMGGRGPPVHSPSRRSHLAPCSLPVSRRPTADQVHRSYRRDGTHPTPRTLPAMWNATAMQTVRSASCLSTCNHVRRATLITAPGARRDDVSSLTLPSGRATVCG